MLDQTKGRRRLALCLLTTFVLFLGGCGPTGTTPSATVVAEVEQTATWTPPVIETETAQPQPTSTPTPETLTADELDTLASLELVEAYPLYTMHYYAPYEVSATGQAIEAYATNGHETSCAKTWGCALFAAMGDPDNRLYGRNFDFMYSPALLLFTHPSDGYASVSMVDIEYLGVDPEDYDRLMDLPLTERRALLYAPEIPMDGMNEQGLVIGMAEVPPGNMAMDPAKETTGSVTIIRTLLDHAADVDEALSIIQEYNIVTQAEIPLHYLIADRWGQAVVVEFFEGEMFVHENQDPWLVATNFLLSSVDETVGECWRYDTIFAMLKEYQGVINMTMAMDLLHEVAQEFTQWSVVYNNSTATIDVVMGSQYENTHTFRLQIPSE